MGIGGACNSMGLGGWLLSVGMWVGVVVLVLWAVNRMFPMSNRRADAEELLDHRLAAGEVDPETYRRIRDELVGTRSR